MADFGRPSLGLKVGLRQTIAPQLIQSLNMLTVPILKLEQMLRHELQTNPMLEEDLEATPEPEMDLEGPAGEKEPALPPEKTLFEHLLEQLNLPKFPPAEHQVGQFIIGNIDENGFLTMSMEEIADA